MKAFTKTRLSRLHDVMAGYVDRDEVAGLVTLVSRNGAVAIEAIGVQDIDTRTPMRRDSIFRIASLSKPITAVAAMTLVEEAQLRLDDPVDAWLPELADRQVLHSVDAVLEDTMPAHRSITLRDLLTLRLGIGAIMATPETFPIQEALADAGLEPNPMPPSIPPDVWMKRLGSLPLVHQPGERWMYHTGSDVLGVLISRVTGGSLEAYLRERIFEPLGMEDTAFCVPDSKLDRFTTCYGPNDETGTLDVVDQACGGAWSQPPVFESAGGGLVSTAEDFLAFSQMLLGHGQLGETRILSRPTVELMTTDQITPKQKAVSPFVPGFWDTTGWGFGVSVVTRRDGVGPAPGSLGWAGGFGTYWACDPVEGMVTMLMAQRLMTGAEPAAIDQDFFTLAYAAIDD